MHSTLNKSQSLSLFSDKVFYKIGEVSKILEIESYVLRYWESEFEFLRPQRTKAGQRIYTKQDIDLLREIKKLLYDEKYTIEGVKKKFQKNQIDSSKIIESSENNPDILSNSLIGSQEESKIILHVKKRLREIIKTL